MKKVIKYTFEKLKLNNKKNIIMIGIFLLLAILIFTIIYCLQTPKVIESVNYDKASLLQHYKEQILINQNKINSGGLSDNEIYFLQRQINEYQLYLNSNTCEYDYISFYNLSQKILNQELRGYSIFYLYGFTYMMILLSIFLGTSTSYEPIKYRMLLNGDVNKKQIYHGKNIINISLLGILFIINFIFVILLNVTSLNQLILINEFEKYTSTNLFTIILGSCLSTLILSLFVYLISLLIGYFFKNKTISFVISLILIFLIIGIDIAFGYSSSNITSLSYLPILNLMYLPFYGFREELLIVFIVYVLLTGALYILDYKVFNKVVR